MLYYFDLKIPQTWLKKEKKKKIVLLYMTLQKSPGLHAHIYKIWTNDFFFSLDFT